MCGIFAYLGDKINIKKIESAFMKTFKRGPDNNILKPICNKLIFGFHRLSINDTSFKGNQPLYHPNKPISVICNGEIYNHKEIIEIYNIKTYSNSDCEIILYLYENYGIEETLYILDSESFAFIIYDGLNNTITVARDRFGVRPLFVSKTSNNEYIFASEAKSIVDLVNENDIIEQFKPGSFKVYNIFGDTVTDNINYYNFDYPFFNEDTPAILQNIRNKLTNAVKKRLMSDRPIGCLLSGGLDSSLISALVAREFKNSGKL